MVFFAGFSVVQLDKAFAVEDLIVRFVFEERVFYASPLAVQEYCFEREVFFNEPKLFVVVYGTSLGTIEI
jgi:hypothetical protein